MKKQKCEGATAAAAIKSVGETADAGADTVTPKTDDQLNGEGFLHIAGRNCKE